MNYNALNVRFIQRYMWYPRVSTLRQSKKDIKTVSFLPLLRKITGKLWQGGGILSDHERCVWQAAEDVSVLTV